MEGHKEKTKSTKPKRTKKSKFLGTVIRQFKVRGVNYEVGSTYNAIEKGSLEYLTNAGYLASKIK